MRSSNLVMLSALSLGLLAGSASAREEAGAQSFVIEAAPPGILVTDLIMETGGYGARKTLKPAYATAEGAKLYTYDSDKTPGQSECYDECASKWKAFVPPAGFKAAAGWSVIQRRDGTAQVALKGKPLYTSVAEATPAPAAEKIAEAANGAAAGEGEKKEKEKVKDEGPWHLAAFSPLEGFEKPAQISVSEMFRVSGQVLVDANGMTLYTYAADTAPNKSACSDACTATWIPAEAGALVQPAGDFTIISRKDGFRQWAYKGKPLYRYFGDTLAGDINGYGVSPSWHVAKIVNYFMPTNVAIHHSPRHGEMLVTTVGQSLYALDKHRYSVGQHNVKRSSYQRGSPDTAAAVLKDAAFTCEQECAQTWKPFVAQADAKPTMLWTIVARNDGSRQWAYMGYPLYTNTADKALGDTRGHDEYHITDPNNAVYWRVVLP